MSSPRSGLQNRTTKEAIVHLHPKKERPPEQNPMRHLARNKATLPTSDGFLPKRSGVFFPLSIVLGFPWKGLSQNVMVPVLVRIKVTGRVR